MSIAAVGATPAPPMSEAVALDGSAKALTRPAVVMLWATWCASCAEELKRVPALASVARPLPFLTLAIDPPDRARAALIRQGAALDQAYADDRPPAKVLAAWGGGSITLPLAVAIDRAGRICGRKHGLLGTNQVAQWSRQCSR